MKNIRIILISLIILVACGSGFYFWAQNNAQEQLSEVEKEITSFVKSKLDEDINITYDFKDFALFSQTINIKNLSVKGSFVEFKIPKLSISVNEDTLSIKNLEELEIAEIGKSGTIVKIASLKIHNLNVEKLLGSKNILDFYTNLKFENFEVLNAKVNHQIQGVTPTELSRLSIESVNSGSVENILLEGLVFQADTNDPIISIESASIDKISDLAPLFESFDRGDSYAIGKHLGNLLVENFEVLNAKVNHQDQGVTPTELSHFSISVNSGSVENILLEGLVFQADTNDPIISIESASIDKISDLAPLFESFDRGDSYAIGKHLGNLLDLGSFEVNGIEVKDPTMYDAAYVDSFNIKLGREDKLVNSVEIKLTGFEVDKSLLEDELDLPPEVLEPLKEDKLKLNIALNTNIDFNTSESTVDFSIGFDKLGKLTFEVVQGGYSKDVVNYMWNNMDSIFIQEFTNKITLKLIKVSFSNEGLTEILMKEAQKNMDLTPDQMVQMVSQEIDNSGEILSADIKEKMKKALTIFIKSGKSIEISIKSKDKDGISEDELYELFEHGPIDKFFELDIKAE
jgi:hypothetical protein